VTGDLEAFLVERIRDRGPLPFAAYMQLVLYHPTHGYYRRHARTGRGGHFMTSPELDPSFGALWARGFERVWHALGRPGEFHVIEVGPGEGGLAGAALASAGGAFGDALRFDLVERSPSSRERQRDLLAGDPRVSWHAALAEVPHVIAGCLFANEVLDNLPVHLAEIRDGTLVELCVSEVRGRLTIVQLPPSSGELEAFIGRAGLPVREGHRYEITLAAESLVSHAARALERGALVFVDYGLESDAYASRPLGTLLAYSPEGADDDVLSRPGQRDVTAHANWTAVRGALERERFEVTGPIPQRVLLRELGADELDERLKTRHADALGRGEGSRAVRALSGRQALGALLDPGGLGGLEVLVGVRGVPADVLQRAGL